MLIYNLFILTIALLLYIDYATNLKILYATQKFNINNLAIFLALGSIAVFAGLRYEIGYDYPKYLAGFLHLIIIYRHCSCKHISCNTGRPERSAFFYTMHQVMECVVVFFALILFYGLGGM